MFWTELQFSKAKWSILIIESDKVIFFKFLFSRKQPVGIKLRLFDNLISSILEHLENALGPISVTESGIIIFSSE